MGKIREVLRREFLERIRRKSFWITTFIIPLLFFFFIFFQYFLVIISGSNHYKIGMLDRDGFIAKNMDLFKPEKMRETGDRVEFFLTKRNPEELNGEVISKKITGYLIIPKNFEEKGISFYAKNTNNIKLINAIESKIKKVAILKRLKKLGLNLKKEKLSEITRGVKLETFKITKKGKTEKSLFAVSFALAFSFIFILYMILLVYGAIAMRGVIEEKTSKIMEVLLSIFSPFELMAGKLLGIGFVGLLQILIYMLFGGIIFLVATIQASVFMPQILELIKNIHISTLIYYIIFFILGYFMYTSLFLGIGSLCSSEEDAQNIQTPVVFMIVIPFISSIYLIQNPNSPVAVIFSFIPFFTPMIMFMRIVTTNPPFWQIFLSIILTSLFTILCVKISAKIFRTGILMYGKRPSFKEILRWIRE